MSLGVYLYRHIRTKQVLVSTEQSVLARPHLLKSQIKPNQRPARIRPDHWTPLVAALGFKDKRAQENAFMLASMAGHPLVAQSAQAQRETVLKPNKEKRLADMDMVERQVAQLARTFMYMDAVKSNTGEGEEQADINLLWEDSSWVARIEEAGLQWPRWVVHGHLDLKRGNIIMNPEVRQGQP
ncbi:hypothetical protein LPJ59_003770 [Coemansia sp. RSA 2399]|nr:hypothetical protein LPJ59_003770 [Coemansia sp. RSA 2399]KAJ1902744.1 hypothetical protein LPJ81_003436 [Coemansia sp. IMI 209127]